MRVSEFESDGPCTPRRLVAIHSGCARRCAGGNACCRKRELMTFVLISRRHARLWLVSLRSALRGF